MKASSLILLLVIISSATLSGPAAAAADIAPPTALHASAAELDRLGDWEALPPMPDRRSREIDGHTWYEGLSATAMGRFANNTLNGLLTESVEDYYFYKSYYDHQGYRGWPRDYFDMIVPGTLNTPVSDDVEADWFHQTRTRTYGSGTATRLVQSAGAPGFLFEHDTDLFVLRKRDVEKRHDDWWVVYPRDIRRGVWPLGILVPRKDGAIELISENPDVAYEVAVNAAMEVREVERPLDVKGPVSWNDRYEIGEPAEPWVVILYPPLEREYWWNDSAGWRTDEVYEHPIYWGDTAIGVLLTFEPGTRVVSELGEIRLEREGGNTIGVSTAFDGLLHGEERDAAAKKKTKDDGRLPAEFPLEKIADRARLVAGMLRRYPVTCTEWYRVDRDAGVLRLRNEFTYDTWDEERAAAAYAPAPTAFSLMRSQTDWPEIPGAEDTGILGRNGPYEVAPGQRVLAYDLDLVTPEYALHPDVTARHDERAVALERELGILRERIRTYLDSDLFSEADRVIEILAGDENPRRWRLAPVYTRAEITPGTAEFEKRWSGPKLNKRALMSPWYSWLHCILAAWPSLDAAARADALERLRAMSIFGLRREGWHIERERYTGQSYYMPGGKEQPNYDPARHNFAADVTDFLGTVLYPAAVYVKYSGDTNFARAIHPRAQDLLRWNSVYADWAWPAISQKPQIFLLQVDPMVMGALVLVVQKQWADLIGTPAEQDAADYMLTKHLAPTLTARAFIPRYIDPDVKEKRLFCSGIGEFGPVMIDPSISTPVTVMQQVGMAYTWVSAYPEIMRAQVAYGGADWWMQWEQNVVDDEQVLTPAQRDLIRSHYNGLRAWLPPWDLRALTDDFLRTRPVQMATIDTFSLLRARLAGAPSFLMDWEPAVIRQFEWNADTRTMTMEIYSDSGAILRFRSWKNPPREALVNGQPVSIGLLPDYAPPAHRDAMGPMFTIQAPQGAATIHLSYGS
jgi:hypothetical protein